MSNAAVIAYQDRGYRFKVNTVQFDGVPEKLGVSLVLHYNDFDTVKMLCEANQIRQIDVDGDVDEYPSKLSKALRIVYTEYAHIGSIENIAQEIAQPFSVRFTYVFMRNIWFVYDAKIERVLPLKRYLGSTLNKYIQTV